MPDVGYNWIMSNDKDAKVWDLLKFNNRTPEEVSLSRLEICKGCEFYKAKSNQCKKCGCFMKLKTTLEHAKCPIGKW